MSRRKWFQVVRYGWAGWISVFGFGFYWRRERPMWLYFSERNGYRKCFTIGSWVIGVFTPRNP